MKTFALVVLLATVLAGGGVWASSPQMPTVDSFVGHPKMTRMRLSPDGGFVAGVFRLGDVSGVEVVDLATGKIERLPTDPESRNTARAVEWLTNDRLAVHLIGEDRGGGGVVAINRDGSKPVRLDHLVPAFRIATPGIAKGEAAIRYREPGGASSYHILLPPLHVFQGDVVTALFPLTEIGRIRRSPPRAGALGPGLYQAGPHVASIDISAGTYDVIVENPGNVERWIVDRNGVARAAQTREEDRWGILYRDAAGDPWRELRAPAEKYDAWYPVAFNASDQKLIVRASSPDKRQAIYEIDPSASALGAPLVADAEYDVALKNPVRSAGELMLGPIRFGQNGAVEGWRYLAPKPVTIWFNSELARMQAAIDRAMPATSNLITDASADGQRFLVLAFSERDPGTYFLFEPATARLRPIERRRTDVDPACMAATEVVSWPARDGMRIHGLLTRPAATDLLPPLVVRVVYHSGLRATWEFDPLTQFLAAQGYAVLDVHPRGFAGYGNDYEAAGREAIGGAVEHDIEAGIRAMVARQVADPARVAIIAQGMGGASALLLVRRHPELFRCAVVTNAITDWPELLKPYIKGALASQREAEYRFVVGENRSHQRAISAVPAAGEITVPILVAHGARATTVPPAQADRLVTAMKRAQRPVERLVLPDSGDVIERAADQAVWYERTAAFLARHLSAPAARAQP